MVKRHPTLHSFANHQIFKMVDRLIFKLGKLMLFKQKSLLYEYIERRPKVMLI
jgi:hypothetical protein